MGEIPWEVGKHEGYKAFVVEVHVCEAEDGQVFFAHRLSKESSAIASSLKSGGEEQIAFALAAEAVRREMFMQALLRMQDSSWLKRYSTASEEEKTAIRGEMCQDVARALVSVVAKLGNQVSLETFEMIQTTD